MRFWVTFNFQEPLKLPIHYNYAIQGIIYKCLSPDLREFLHNYGFSVGGRSFKLFTFSRIFGRYKRDGETLIFARPIRLCISSPVERFVREIVNNLLKIGSVRLIGNELSISSVEFPDKPAIGDELVCQTLSPVTVYSTLLTSDGRKKTYYYSPYEEEFSELAEANLRKKIGIITGEPVTGGVAIKPISRPREVVCFFKKTIVKGWMGRFRLVGDRRLIEAAYEAGLGSKNSAGFGMIEVVDGA